MEIVNKYFSREYDIIELFEAGIVLSGPEVKACKQGNVSFQGAYCSLGEDGILVLKNFYIAPYAPAAREQISYEPLHLRRLLLRKHELKKLHGRLSESGVTLVPKKLYTKNRIVKVQIALAKGLVKKDKREKLKKREFERRQKRQLVSR